MKKLLSAALLLVPIAFHPAFAATDQQNRMTTCNKEATGKKDDERKAFMKDCLSSKPAGADTHVSQQDRMKTCNAEASGKKGDERKQFMSACLKTH